MKTFTITRTDETEKSTLGKMTLGGKLLCWTL